MRPELREQRAIEREIEELKRMPNVTLLEERTHSHVPGAIQGSGDVVRYIAPSKKRWPR